MEDSSTLRVSDSFSGDPHLPSVGTIKAKILVFAIRGLQEGVGDWGLTSI